MGGGEESFHLAKAVADNGVAFLEKERSSRGREQQISDESGVYLGETLVEG